MFCAQGPAPRAATVTRYRDELGLDLVPGTGPLAAVVPGSFGGWLTMLRDYGTLPLGEVLRFAIGYAEEGYPWCRRSPARFATSKALPRRVDDLGGGVPAGARARHAAPNPALAATYRRILDESHGDIDAALDCWYRGFVAEAFVGFQAQEWLDSSGERHAGLLARRICASGGRRTSRRSRSTTTA